MWCLENERRTVFTYGRVKLQIDLVISAMFTGRQRTSPRREISFDE